MKRLYNLLACSVLAVAVAFTSCKPLDKTFDGLGPKPVATPPAKPTVDAITLADADFALLPSSNLAQTNHFFTSLGDAIGSIPTILNGKYPTAVEKSQITVTFPLGPVVPSIKLADSLFSDVSYTPTTDDYYSITGKYADFSTAQAVLFLKAKYKTPVPNQLSVLNYTYYESGVTTSAGVPNTVHSYLYLNGTWTKIYMVSPAQYVSAGRGLYNELTTTDAPNLVNIFNIFLKADVQVASTVHTGDVIYVSFNYYAGKDFQRVMPLVFDGTNWVASQNIVSAMFAKTSGEWVGTTDNSVHYTLSPANFTTISAIPNAASPLAITDIKAHSDFSLSAGSGNLTGDGARWTDAQIANSIITILKAQYTAPSNNQKFYITFKTYGAYPTETYEFNFDGTNFVYLSVPDNAKYTLTGDDYTAIVNDPATGATAAATQNLNQYGDFSSAWDAVKNINPGIANVLKTRYPAAAANQVVAVSYGAYTGSNVIVVAPFKFDGTKWTAQ